jgi:hypothetical protein
MIGKPTDPVIPAEAGIQNNPRRAMLRRGRVNPPLIPHSWGKIWVIGGHPQTPGRDDSLHPLRISDLQITETNKGLRPPPRPMHEAHHCRAGRIRLRTKPAASVTVGARLAGP